MLPKNVADSCRVSEPAGTIPVRRGCRVAWSILWRSGRCDLSSNLSNPIISQGTVMEKIEDVIFEVIS